MRVLTLNCGSSSIKAAVFALNDGRLLPLARAGVSGLPSRPAATIEADGGPAGTFEVAAGSGYGDATTGLLEALASRGLLAGVEAVGHRVVHGGSDLTAPAPLTAETIRQIEAVSALAPLHNAPALEAIEACRRVLSDVPMAATFDTAFFATLPDEASTYALPAEVREKLGIRRFGFHGLAHRYMSRRLAALSGRPGLRAVTLQLGAGCSATAVRGGVAIDTSMGFTPLEGLVMTSRSGDIDPALPVHLIKNASLSPDEVDRLLNQRSGLLGLSGISGDMRDLLKEEAAGSEPASLALRVFVYRVRKYIGAYAAALGGIDALVFGGGIGENRPEVRERVCAGFDWLGLEFDAGANSRARASEALLSRPGSRVLCYVLPVDEAEVIAEDTLGCLYGKEGGTWQAK